MARTYTFTVGPTELAPGRLDQYLSKRLPDFVSRTAVQRAIRQGAVTVNSAVAKANHRLHSGDSIIALMEQLPAPSSGIELVPQSIPFDIRYEDDHVLVVNKPVGLVTHPAPGNWDGTLVNAILGYYNEGAWDRAGKAEADEETVLPRAGIVHRLDKDTSGLLIVAKTDAALLKLSRQLKDRSIHRVYLALVEGHLPMDTGTVNAAIGRHPTNRKLMTIRHLGGRQAVTHFRVLRRLDYRQTRQAFPCTWLDLTLETGRTHQIRVHMAHLGHPVVGDLTYGHHPESYWQTVGISRQLLHAHRIRFRHPATGVDIELSAPLPQDMADWWGDAPLPGEPGSAVSIR